VPGNCGHSAWRVKIHRIVAIGRFAGDEESARRTLAAFPSVDVLASREESVCIGCSATGVLSLTVFNKRRASMRYKAPLVGFALATVAQVAIAQSVTSPMAKDPNLRQVSMVKQDQSDCQDGNVNDQPPNVIGGTAYVVRRSDNTTTVKVGITAKPNTVYHFFLKCVRLLGDITTYDEGAGGGEFTFRTNEVGNVFAFDMYPDGAPPGNKYQSVQVKY